jgi:acetyl CoA:N6-hydroxylysine acetyl transferase
MTTETATMCPASASPLPDWCDLVTRAGRFTLSPVRPDRDLPQLHRWLNDPAVDQYWELGGGVGRVADHLAELRDTPHARGYVGRLAGRAVSYWEIYRAAEDRLGRYYPARPTDLGVHLLIGEPDCRGIGLGAVLLTALAESLSGDGSRRVVAEPDERNLPSLRAFAKAGFRREGTVALPEKNAALMVRDPGGGSAPAVGVPPRPRAAVDGLMRRAD